MSRRSRPQIVGVHQAGDDAAVVTVEGGGGSYRRRPCEPDAAGVGCPWVVEHVGQWPAEAFRHSAHTAYDQATETFGCHKSTPAAPQTCAGFLLRGADHNLSVRMRARLGAIDLDQVHDGGRTLHESYRAMAIANGVDPDDERLRPCRSSSGDDYRERPEDLLARLLGPERAAAVLAEFEYGGTPTSAAAGSVHPGQHQVEGGAMGKNDEQPARPLPAPGTGAAAAGGEVGRKIAEAVTRKGEQR